MASTAEILTTGFTEGIAATESDYIARAVALAEDVSRLATLRRELRGKLMSSSLANPRHVAAGLEDADRLIWRDWCNADDR